VTGDRQDVEELIKSNYVDGDLLRQRHGGESVAKPRSTAFRDLFSAQQYDGGALVLYALRQKVGDAMFQRIERRWVTKYAGKKVKPLKDFERAS
jgi:hypothetical protein